jgi:hypothetical protein
MTLKAISEPPGVPSNFKWKTTTPVGYQPRYLTQSKWLDLASMRVSEARESSAIKQYAHAMSVSKSVSSFQIA